MSRGGVIFFGTPRQSWSVTQTINIHNLLYLYRTFALYVCWRTEVCAKQRVDYLWNDNKKITNAMVCTCNVIFEEGIIIVYASRQSPHFLCRTMSVIDGISSLSWLLLIRANTCVKMEEFPMSGGGGWRLLEILINIFASLKSQVFSNFVYVWPGLILIMQTRH